MIAFAVDLQIYDQGDVQYTQALLRLDTDGDKPELDVRLRDDDDHIVNCDVQDAYDVLVQIKRQLDAYLDRQAVEA